MTHEGQGPSPEEPVDLQVQNEALQAQLAERDAQLAAIGEAFQDVTAAQEEIRATQAELRELFDKSERQFSAADMAYDRLERLMNDYRKPEPGDQPAGVPVDEKTQTRPTVTPPQNATTRRRFFEEDDAPVRRRAAAPTPPKAETKKRRSGKALLALGATALALAVGGVGVYFLAKNDDEKVSAASGDTPIQTSRTLADLLNMKNYRDNNGDKAGNKAGQGAGVAGAFGASSKEAKEQAMFARADRRNTVPGAVKAMESNRGNIKDHIHEIFDQSPKRLIHNAGGRHNMMNSILPAFDKNTKTNRFDAWEAVAYGVVGSDAYAAKVYNAMHGSKTNELPSGVSTEEARQYIENKLTGEGTWTEIGTPDKVFLNYGQKDENVFLANILDNRKAQLPMFMVHFGDGKVAYFKVDKEGKCVNVNIPTTITTPTPGPQPGPTPGPQPGPTPGPTPGPQPGPRPTPQSGPETPNDHPQKPKHKTERPGNKTPGEQPEKPVPPQPERPKAPAKEGLGHVPGGSEPLSPGEQGTGPAGQTPNPGTGEVPGEHVPPAPAPAPTPAPLPNAPQPGGGGETGQPAPGPTEPTPSTGTTAPTNTPEPTA